MNPNDPNKTPDHFIELDETSPSERSRWGQLDTEPSIPAAPSATPKPAPVPPGHGVGEWINDRRDPWFDGGDPCDG
jgi:hypothetical protein